MIQGVGQNGFAKAAIEAALQSMQQRTGRVDAELARGLDGSAAAGGAPQTSFADALSQGLSRAEQSVQSTDALPLDLLSGKVGDFHEVAGQLKQAELVFKFSMEVRNKLIDAYRETMRMSV